MDIAELRPLLQHLYARSKEGAAGVGSNADRALTQTSYASAWNHAIQLIDYCIAENGNVSVERLTPLLNDMPGQYQFIEKFWPQR